MSSSIYTRGGDKGQTSLASGERVPKDAPRVEAYGTVDEANSWIGVARVRTEDPLLDRALEMVQHRLFNCSSNLATPPGAAFEPARIAAEDVAWLEQAIDRFEQKSGAISSFVLPGGCGLAATLQVARAVCRRAERRIVSLGAEQDLDPLVLKFVNRASDFLFAAARYANALSSDGDLAWDKDLPLPQL